MKPNHYGAGSNRSTGQDRKEVIPDIQLTCGCGMRGKCKQHQQPKSKEKWEEKFNKKFTMPCSEIKRRLDFNLEANPETVKQFITKLLAQTRIQERKDTIEEIKSKFIEKDGESGWSRTFNVRFLDYLDKLLLSKK